MKKLFLLIPTIALPLLSSIPAISGYTSVANNKLSHKNVDIIAQTTQNDANNYSVVTPSWTHYAVGEKLDLRDLKVTYNDPQKGDIDVTSECKLSRQNNEELKEAGEFDVNIQHNDFNSSFKIYVENEPHEISNNDPYAKMGDIDVEYKLMSNQECIFTDYEDGEGTLEIPDYIEYNGIKYFIKQIPSDWSDGENDITGLEFKCSHLKKICNDAFAWTNCLDYYINHKDQLLEFPEGLEEIGEEAFYGTDWGTNKIKGYSFPSTLKKIGSYAFLKSPYIDGDDNNGELWFKSVPEIDSDAFHINGICKHNCKWIYGSTLDIAKEMSIKLKEHSDFFYTAKNFLIPCLIEGTFLIDVKFGDITVKCCLIDNKYSEDNECTFVNYVDGKGTLKIPDHVEHNGKKFYIKEIAHNWSDGENDITGLEFAKDCRHLKKICNSAFAWTNCLDYYIDHKDQLLQFPEGLEEIGKFAFTGTDCGQNSIKGYSFPSTLKKIDAFAFGESAPYIDGDNKNGELRFKSVPEIDYTAFFTVTSSTHYCKWIYGSTQEIAEQITKTIRGSNLIDYFNSSNDYLLPHIMQENYESIKTKFGDITVECKLNSDECLLSRYVDGSGTLIIPDSVEYNEKKYYVKEIPPNWSDGENDITGLKFECKHLKKIWNSAFKGTNCLDYYINNRNELLEFPEGLEEIGDYAFKNTDIGQNKIKGYSFPSTLKKIGKEAFSSAPYIDGDNDNGELQFKSIPEIDKNAFHICRIPIHICSIFKHNCKYVSGKTQDIAEHMAQFFRNELNDDFNVDSNYLIPKLMEK